MWVRLCRARLRTSNNVQAIWFDVEYVLREMIVMGVIDEQLPFTRFYYLQPTANNMCSQNKRDINYVSVICMKEKYCQSMYCSVLFKKTDIEFL